VALGLCSRGAHAEVAFERLDALLDQGVARRALARGSWRGEISGLSAAVTAPGRWVPLGSGDRQLFRGLGDATSLRSLFSARRSWSPPRHLLMDRARAAIEWPVVEAGAGPRGQGVVIGIVDTGVDVAHPELRAADGRTRVAWLLDFFADPAGSQPALEQRYGCASEDALRCRILSAADIDARLSNAVVGDEPADELGHGTHIASLAAGNGASDPVGRYSGVAPEATLIVVAAAGRGATLADNDIVLGTQFVFERAEELGLPAVVNLSVGSDFGAHGDASELGASLAAFVGPEHPGRAIVVAAGNSGSLLHGLVSGVEEPLGIHTEVELPAQGSLELPLLTPPLPSGGDTTDATVYVWLELGAGMQVGLHTPDGLRIEPVPAGGTGSARSDALEVVVINGASAEQDLSEWTERSPTLRQSPPGGGSAVILVDGRWPAGQSFSIDLEGQGHAALWLQSEGDLGPSAHATGALFASATARSTVTIPAAHSGLIAVGASVNRLSWTDRTGSEVVVKQAAYDADWIEGAAAFFSSGGPSSDGRLKPELTAPGALVIGALASQADPRRDLFSIFSAGHFCERILDCQIVDERHALTGGTSMAAPMVSGAVALLFEQNPALTQPELRDLLLAGARAPGIAEAPRDGAGTLALATSLDAASGSGAGAAVDAEHSRLVFAREAALPDPERPFELLLQLRDGAGRPVPGIDGRRLRLELSGGVLAAELEQAAPGLYRGSVAAAAGPALLRVDVFLDETPLLSGSLPIEPTPASPDADRGCSLSGPGERASALRRAGAWWLAGLVALAARRRRSIRAQISAR
jgi:subtilisin family serine protease